jgi:hypothetical protein
MNSKLKQLEQWQCADMGAAAVRRRAEFFGLVPSAAKFFTAEPTFSHNNKYLAPAEFFSARIWR